MILQNCFSFINYFLTLLTKLTYFCNNQKMTPWVKCYQNIKCKFRIKKYLILRCKSNYFFNYPCMIKYRGHMKYKNYHQREIVSTFIKVPYTGITMNITISVRRICMLTSLLLTLAKLEIISRPSTLA